MQNSFNLPLELAMIAIHLVSNPMGIIGDIFQCPPHPGKIPMGLRCRFDPAMQQFLSECVQI